MFENRNFDGRHIKACAVQAENESFKAEDGSGDITSLRVGAKARKSPCSCRVIEYHFRHFVKNRFEDLDRRKHC